MRLLNRSNSKQEIKKGFLIRNDDYLGVLFGSFQIKCSETPDIGETQPTLTGLKYLCLGVKLAN